MEEGRERKEKKMMMEEKEEGGEEGRRGREMGEGRRKRRERRKEEERGNRTTSVILISLLSSDDEGDSVAEGWEDDFSFLEGNGDYSSWEGGNDWSFVPDKITDEELASLNSVPIDYYLVADTDMPDYQEYENYLYSILPSEHRIIPTADGTNTTGPKIIPTTSGPMSGSSGRPSTANTFEEMKKKRKNNGLPENYLSCYVTKRRK